MKYIAITAAVITAVCLLAFAPDLGATGVLLLANAGAIELEALKKALLEHGGAIKEFAGRIGDEVREIRQQMLDLAQKVGTRPAGGLGGGGGSDELAELITKSAGFSAFMRGDTPSFKVEIPSRLLHKNTITNQPAGATQILAPADRGPAYIPAAPEQRLTIRALFRQIPVSSSVIERAVESSYVNAAAPQGGDASPTGAGEGALKAQSDLGFTLQTTQVVQLAHYIVLSRQVLADAPLLQAHVESRLLYGLNQEEEDEMLAGTGAAGTMSGINQNATAFNGGQTNATRLDTLARGASQLAVSNYTPSGFILHPTNWLQVMLEKDTTNRYMFADPGAMQRPQLWGLPVIVTPSQTLGNFTCIDALRYGWVADREGAEVRISENVNDAFIRNLIHVRAEKRSALVTELGAAAVYGSLTYTG